MHKPSQPFILFFINDAWWRFSVYGGFGRRDAQGRPTSLRVICGGQACLAPLWPYHGRVKKNKKKIPLAFCRCSIGKEMGTRQENAWLSSSRYLISARALQCLKHGLYDHLERSRTEVWQGRTRGSSQSQNLIIKSALTNINKASPLWLYYLWFAGCFFFWKSIPYMSPPLPPLPNHYAAHFLTQLQPHNPSVFSGHG